ncbi:MAG TPA: hemin uptake protein HemP [Candidatus Binatia bacterium]|jgi:hemin uptake protein HemP
MKNDNAKTNGETPLPSDKIRVESSSLFRGGREIVIVHDEQEYSLRITRNGKLILTK